MAGAPLEAATAAGESWLSELESSDRFNVVPYASQPYPFAGRAPQATEEAVDEAVAFMADQEPLGLSDPAEAVITALELERDTLLQRNFFGCSGTRRPDGEGPPRHDQPIVDADGEAEPVAPYVVLLTDGTATVGLTGEDEIAWAVSDANVVAASLFAIGVGPDVDQRLLERLASDHRGRAAFAETPEDVEAVVTELRDRIRDPLLVRPQLQIDGTWDAAPETLEDAGAGFELVYAFRWDTPGDVDIVVQALRGRETIDEQWTVTLPDVDARLPAVARAWAQLRVQDLDAAYAAGDSSVYSAIADLVADYGVASDVVALGFDGSEDLGDASGGYAVDMASGCGVTPMTRSLLAHLLAPLLVLGVRRRSQGSPSQRGS